MVCCLHVWMLMHTSSCLPAGQSSAFVRCDSRHAGVQVGLLQHACRLGVCVTACSLMDACGAACQPVLSWCHPHGALTGEGGAPEALGGKDSVVKLPAFLQQPALPGWRQAMMLPERPSAAVRAYSINLSYRVAASGLWEAGAQCAARLQPCASCVPMTAGRCTLVSRRS